MNYERWENTKMSKIIITVTLSTSNTTRPFKWFLISAEDPDVDNNNNQEDLTNIDVGTLKPLKDQQSRYYEKCAKTVQETDNSDKTKIEVRNICV